MPGSKRDGSPAQFKDEEKNTIISGYRSSVSCYSITAYGQSSEKSSKFVPVKSVKVLTR